MRVLVLLSLLMPAELACKCAGFPSVCESFHGADLVFTGRATSLDPEGSRIEELAAIAPDGDLSSVERDRSPETFLKVRGYLLGFFSDARRDLVARATNTQELLKVAEQGGDEGQRITFRILTAYKGLGASARDVDVWASFGACGPSFTRGETYVVYARLSENGGYSIGMCSRSPRLTEAGADLAFLHFVQATGQPAVRVHGVVARDEAARAPVSGVIVGLRSRDAVLIDSTGSGGEFTFDGVEPGEYTLTVYHSDAEDAQPLAPPRQISVSGSRCVEERVHIPNTSARSQ